MPIVYPVETLIIEMMWHIIPYIIAGGIILACIRLIEFGMATDTWDTNFSNALSEHRM